MRLGRKQCNEACVDSIKLGPWWAYAAGQEVINHRHAAARRTGAKNRLEQSSVPGGRLLQLLTACTEAPQDQLSQPTSHRAQHQSKSHTWLLLGALKAERQHGVSQTQSRMEARGGFQGVPGLSAGRAPLALLRGQCHQGHSCRFA